MSVKLFIEGGSNNSDVRARKGFSDFLAQSELGVLRKLPRIVVCGSRGDAIRDYLNRANDSGLLLIDSEGPVKDPKKKVEHLVDRKDLSPDEAKKVDEDDLFFMIETMESWLIANIESFQNSANSDAIDKAIKKRNNSKDDVEKISKGDAETLVKNCLAQGQSKGKRMELMGKLDFGEVADRAPELRALIHRLEHL